MPYAYCLAPVVWSWSLMSSVVLCLMQLSLSEGLGLCSLFYQGCFALHPWIACLGYVHHEITCLASQASDWASAFWNSLSDMWLATHCYVSIQA